MRNVKDAMIRQICRGIYTAYKYRWEALKAVGRFVTLAALLLLYLAIPQLPWLTWLGF